MRKKLRRMTYCEDYPGDGVEGCLQFGSKFIARLEERSAFSIVEIGERR